MRHSLLQGSAFVQLTRKASLLAAAALIPKTVSDVKEIMILPGYITGVTNDACYVRFLGHLTGRAGLAQLADSFVSDPHRHFSQGQSVRAQVVQVGLGQYNTWQSSFGCAFCMSGGMDKPQPFDMACMHSCDTLTGKDCIAAQANMRTGIKLMQP